MPALSAGRRLPVSDAAPPEGPAPHEGSDMLQLLTDLFTGGAFDALQSIIDIIHWED